MPVFTDVSKSNRIESTNQTDNAMEFPTSCETNWGLINCAPRTPIACSNTINRNRSIKINYIVVPAAIAIKGLRMVSENVSVTVPFWLKATNSEGDWRIIYITLCLSLTGSVICSAACLNEVVITVC